ncbi:unnamed protein product [Ambrosiozyma monospora]|uniref:Unnamed protein product n=1 Tax=Ambrosiozyma monospora TaxID=43982 RepID=A0ACB5T085_AMBMO|nr:unnamed protein product [Ambrosiozyma monospora]
MSLEQIPSTTPTTQSNTNTNTTNDYTPSRTKLYKNTDSINWNYTTEFTNDNYNQMKDASFRFHKSLPDYLPTPLVRIPFNINSDNTSTTTTSTSPYSDKDIEVYVKMETSRFNLPSFKMLGTGWGIFKILCLKFGLDYTVASFTDLKTKISNTTATAQSPLTLLACTDGNHGRAVARMAAMLGLPSLIIVPRNVLDTEVAKIESEPGCTVQRVQGNYDFAVEYCDLLCGYSESLSNAAETGNGEMNFGGNGYVWVQDFGTENYTEVPVWIAEGYSTICRELPSDPDLIVVPCGSGCLPHGITAYFRDSNSKTHVMLAEPFTAHCVNKSLSLASASSDSGTSMTIMDGLNCPTVSFVAWPVLRDGVSFSGLVGELDVVEAVLKLKEEAGLDVGPCGGVSFAALMNFVSGKDDGQGGLLKELKDLKMRNGDDGPVRVVLLATEAGREFSLREEGELLKSRL